MARICTKKENAVKENTNQENRQGMDRIEGNRIIIHDHYPSKYRMLNEIVIITQNQTYTRKFIKSKTGKYMLQK